MLACKKKSKKSMIKTCYTFPSKHEAQTIFLKHIQLISSSIKNLNEFSLSLVHCHSEYFHQRVVNQQLAVFAQNNCCSVLKNIQPALLL